MPDSPFHAALRQRFAGFDSVTSTRFALGVERIDKALGGGLAHGRLHEVWPATAADQPGAAGFALMLALRAGGRDGNIVWLTEDRGARRDGRLYPPGLAELGADPARLLFVTAPDETSLLRAAADLMRSPAAGTVVIALAGAARAFDLTASRRLTLFAERSGVNAILLRTRDPTAPSAAMTRWRVAAAPSAALEANAPGHPAFTLDLVRQRGGAPVSGWRLEWRRDDAAFAPLSGDLPADAGRGSVAAG